jgi:hypothetical protein
MTNVKYDTYFKCKDLDIVSRGDYESLPAPMYAGEFDDEKMSKLAEDIYQTLHHEYGYTDDELHEFFTNPDAWENEKMSGHFWIEMETIAINMGMRYYEDMSEEEYNAISEK